MDYWITAVIGPAIVLTLCIYGLFFRKKDWSPIKKWSLSVVCSALVVLVFNVVIFIAILSILP